MLHANNCSVDVVLFKLFYVLFLLGHLEIRHFNSSTVPTVSLTYIGFLQKANCFIGRVYQPSEQFLLLTLPFRLHAVPLPMRCFTECLHVLYI